MGRISPGVPSSRSTGRMLNSAASTSAAALKPDKTTAVPAHRRRSGISSAPKAWAMGMANPCASPTARLSQSQLNQSALPRAARAESPMPRPTTAASTTVYSCWNRLPDIRGRATFMIRGSGRPSVIFCVRMGLPPGGPATGALAPVKAGIDANEMVQLGITDAARASSGLGPGPQGGGSGRPVDAPPFLGKAAVGVAEVQRGQPVQPPRRRRARLRSAPASAVARPRRARFESLPSETPWRTGIRGSGW